MELSDFAGSTVRIGLPSGSFPSHRQSCSPCRTLPNFAPRATSSSRIAAKSSAKKTIFEDPLRPGDAGLDMQRDRRPTSGKLAPPLFLRNQLHPEHLAIEAAHRFHLPGKKNHPRELHPVSTSFTAAASPPAHSHPESENTSPAKDAPAPPPDTSPKPRADTRNAPAEYSAAPKYKAPRQNPS